MINEKNKFLTVSWLSGLLSAEIFISTGEWGVQMPPLTSENSHFLWSGPQEATLVMLFSFLFRAIEFGGLMVIFHYIYQNCSSSFGWYIIAACVSTTVLGI